MERAQSRGEKLLLIHTILILLYYNYRSNRANYNYIGFIHVYSVFISYFIYFVILLFSHVVICNRHVGVEMACPGISFLGTTKGVSKKGKKDQP